MSKVVLLNFPGWPELLLQQRYFIAAILLITLIAGFGQAHRRKVRRKAY